MRRIAAPEPVPLDHAFKTAPFCEADGVNKIAFGKEAGPENISWFHFLGKITKLLDSFDRRSVELLQMSEQRLGYAMLFLIFKPKLDRFIAVALDGFALDNPVWPHAHNGDRHQH